ncbi:MAG TPA: sigma-70 family RNA polymerase sigma factor [Baekduia sp.]
MPPASSSDLALHRRFRDGDEAAFAAVAGSHRADLVRYAAQLLRDDVASAEDAVQEALWRAYRARRRLTGELAVRAWLFAIVRNACFDELRRRRPAETPLEHDRCAPSGDPADVVLRRQALRGVLAEVAALPPRQRAVVEATIFGGQSHGALAATLQTSPGASKALLHRARTTLHARRSGDGDGAQDA